MKRLLTGLLVSGVLVFSGCKVPKENPQLEKPQEVKTEESSNFSISEQVESEHGEAPEDNNHGLSISERVEAEYGEAPEDGLTPSQIEKAKEEEETKNKDMGLYKKVEKDSLEDFKQKETDDYNNFKKTHKLFGN